MTEMGRSARAAARVLASSSVEQRNEALLQIRAAIAADRDAILAANEMDLGQARESGLEAALLDRLALTPAQLDVLEEGLSQVAALPDPIGAVSDMRQMPSGIDVGTMRVPLGVIGMIYESRPNVTIEAASLCLKAGNAVILRGGSEAIHCNKRLGESLAAGLAAAGLPVEAAQVVPVVDRAAVGALLTMPEYVDMVVPRGGKGLIERVAAESKVPVLAHLDGICHVYIDIDADRDKAHRIAFNAKTQRYGTCNTMETLLVARARADMLPSWSPRCSQRVWRSEAARLPGRPLLISLLMLWKQIGQPSIWHRSSRSSWWKTWTMPCPISRDTGRITPRVSSLRTRARRSASYARWIRDRLCTMPRPDSPTVLNMVSARKLVSPPASCMRGVLSGWRGSPLENIS